MEPRITLIARINKRQFNYETRQRREKGIALASQDRIINGRIIGDRKSKHLRKVEINPAKK